MWWEKSKRSEQPDLTGPVLSSKAKQRFCNYYKLISSFGVNTILIKYGRRGLLYRTAGTWMVNMAAGGWSGTTADSVFVDDSAIFVHWDKC
jgi:hypothetical protein